MSNWATRAKQHFSDECQNVTPITPETHLLGVLGASSERISTNDEQVLGVLGVAPLCISKNHADSAARLMAAAMLACDHFNDSDTAREEMHQQVMELPPEKWQDLTEHFRKTYAAGGARHG